jgi:hypothetical protein
MTGHRRVVIWAWIAAVLAAGIFPPWVQGGYPRGYYLLFSPPPYTRAHIDSSQLIVEWVLMSVVALGCIFAWPKRAARKAPAQTPLASAPPTEQPPAPEVGQSYPMANGTATVKSVDNGVVRFEHQQPGGQIAKLTLPVNVFWASITQPD